MSLGGGSLAEGYWGRWLPRGRRTGSRQARARPCCCARVTGVPADAGTTRAGGSSSPGSEATAQPKIRGPLTPSPQLRRFRACCGASASSARAASCGRARSWWRTRRPQAPPPRGSGRVSDPRLWQVQLAVNQRGPLLVADAQKTPSWQFPIRPAVPEYCRCTPADLVPSSGTRSHRPPACQIIILSAQDWHTPNPNNEVRLEY
jgi:hypothetical protein